MKKISLIFLVACIAVCFVPLVGMTARPTTETTENKTMSAFPSVRSEDGSVNLSFFEEFGDYFNEHFAFRNELVYADAEIQGAVLHVSNEDTVIYGQDGWLYYASTLSDYLGTDVMTDRQIYNLAHNIALVCRYVEDRGSDFVLAIPPNKNTLYGENMPYYDAHIVDETHNVDLLAPLLSGMNVPYADLLALFRSQEEVLYLKRDSHWNNKGALMAYNCVMDTLGYAHGDYADVSAARVKDEDGDLNRMLYTFYGEKEYNYTYDVEYEYTYANDVESVEDVWIETECGSGDGTLLMFRDSFANTLIPWLAEQFGQAWFTKETPYGLESLMDTYDPDAVVFEKAERNISDFIERPPIISAVEADAPEITQIVESATTVSVETLEYDTGYYKIGGSVDGALLSDETDILVEVNGVCYSAYHTGDNGYEVYLPKEEIENIPAKVRILTEDEGICQVVLEKTIDEGEYVQ